MEARNFNMLRTTTVGQKSFVERQGYFVTGAGQVTTSQSQHIVALLKTYDNGQMVAVLGANKWASVVKNRDRRTQYVPGSRQVDEVTRNVGKVIAIHRTQTIQDKIVPYLTERHRMKGVTPVPRTVTKTIVMVIPGKIVTRLRQSSRAKKGANRLAYIRERAARLLNEHPGTSLNAHTWMALLDKVNVPGTPGQFSSLMKALGARSVGRAMALKCWTLNMVKECHEGTRNHPRKMDPPMVFAGGQKASKNLLRMARGQKPVGKMPKDIPDWTVPMSARDGVPIVKPVE